MEEGSEILLAGMANNRKFDPFQTADAHVF
jgi:hypothetical protein